MLPPDNFQETPQPVVAPRTSPTNIGIYLLSVLSARDFGWISLADAAERLEATIATIEKLETLSRPSLQLVRHQDAEAAAIRSMCRASTAAISPAI